MRAEYEIGLAKMRSLNISPEEAFGVTEAEIAHSVAKTSRLRAAWSGDAIHAFDQLIRMPRPLFSHYGRT